MGCAGDSRTSLAVETLEDALQGHKEKPEEGPEELLAVATLPARTTRKGGANGRAVPG
jgi:hypothetical protein